MASYSETLCLQKNETHNKNYGKLKVCSISVKHDFAKETVQVRNKSGDSTAADRAEEKKHGSR